MSNLEVKYGHPLDFVVPQDYDGPDLEVTTRDRQLADSIREHGVARPIFVRGQIVDNGVRRVRLALKYGLERIPYIDVQNAKTYYAKEPRASLFRVINRNWEEIKELNDLDEAARRESATGVPGVTSAKAAESIERWKVFENATGWSKMYITTAFIVFNELHARAGNPDDDESKRILSTFRNYGVEAAMRMMNIIKEELDGSEPDPSRARMDYTTSPYITTTQSKKVKHTDEQAYKQAVATLRREIGPEPSVAAAKALEYLES